MVIKNGNRVIYEKKIRTTGENEKDTTAFYDDKIVMLEENKEFKVDDTDKYTIVIWVEGDDPDCTDELIGGEIKMHMRLTEQHLDKNEDTNENEK